jgi:hypothetical protein
MATYVGGTEVKSGTYIDPSSLAFVHVREDGGALPGGAERRWKRIPIVLLAAAAPVLGGLFVVALPIVGFGAAAYAIGRKLTHRARAGAKEIAATVTPRWVPGEAHLTGKPPEAGAGEAAPARDERMQELEKEIGEKRNPAK